MVQAPFKPVLFVLFALITQLGLSSAQSYCGQTDNTTLVAAHWEECPTNFSVYTGCNAVSVEAIFCNKNHSSICDDYELNVSINGYIVKAGVELLEEFVTTCTFNDTVNNENVMTFHNQTGCKVNVITNISTSGVHDVIFTAKTIDENPQSKHCCDLITVKDTISPPSNITSEVNCDTFTLNWTAPSVLPGYYIYGYSINITEAENNELVYNDSISNTTSTEVEHRNHFIPNKEYRVDIRTLYCGGTSNESAMHKLTIIEAPRVNIEHLTYFPTSSAIVVKANVDVKCPISHPTSVTVQLNCSGSEQNTTKMHVNIDDNGEIPLRVIAHTTSDSASAIQCNVSLKWMNTELMESKELDIWLNVSNEKLYRAYFLPHEGNEQLQLTKYMCLITYCCIRNNSSCSHSVSHNITHIIVSPDNRELSCDGSYYFFCEEGTIEKTSDACQDISQYCTVTVTTTMDVKPTNEITNVTDDAPDQFSLAVMILVCVTVLLMIFIFVIMVSVLIVVRCQKSTSNSNTEKLTEIEEKLDLIRTHVAEQKSASAETENGKTTTEPGEHIENDNVAQKSTKDKSPTELQQFGR